MHSSRGKQQAVDDQTGQTACRPLSESGSGSFRGAHQSEIRQGGVGARLGSRHGLAQDKAQGHR